MMDFGGRRPAEAKDPRLDSEHLLAIHPSSRVGSAATPFRFARFLGSHSEIYRTLHAHTLMETLREVGKQGGARTLDLGA